MDISTDSQVHFVLNIINGATGDDECMNCDGAEHDDDAHGDEAVSTGADGACSGDPPTTNAAASATGDAATSTDYTPAIQRQRPRRPRR